MSAPLRVDIERAQKMREAGKTITEIAAEQGVSRPSVSKALKRASGKITSIQQHKDTKKEQGAPAGETAPEQDMPEAAAFQVTTTPAGETERPSFFDRAKDKLGLAPEKDVTPKVQSRRLNKGQQEFVDLAQPIATELGKAGGAWAWEKLAKDYYHPILAPDDEIAEKIMAPWCRILARTFSVQFKGKITPNGLDMMASLAAMAGYGLTSWQMYQEIRREDRYGAQEEDSAGTRARAGAVRAERQTVESASSNLHAPGFESKDDSSNGGGVRRSAPQSGSPDIRALSPTERFQYESLNRLRNQDYASRVRRSGTLG